MLTVPENALRGFNKALAQYLTHGVKLPKPVVSPLVAAITILISSEFIMQLLVLMEIRTIGHRVQKLKVPAPKVTALFLLEIMLLIVLPVVFSYLVQILKPIFLLAIRTSFTVGLACIPANTNFHKQKIIKFCCHLINHRQEYNNGFWEFTGYHRTLTDEFILSQENPRDYEYEARHKTLVYGLGFTKETSGQ